MEKDQNSDLKCPICLEWADNPVESRCCGHVFCRDCVNRIKTKFNQCPCCKAHNMQTSQSKIAKRMISSLKVQCPNGCVIKLHFGDLADHRAKCPQQPLKCIFCSGIFKRKNMVEHTTANHLQQVSKAIIGIHLDQKPEKIVQNKQDSQYFIPKKNKQGLIGQLGQTGKYYCGGQLIGKCSCCDGHCGKTNGENCDACMELDLNRLKLDKGYLVNPAGYVCLYDNNTSLYHCGRTSESAGIFSRNRLSCYGPNQCSSCAQINNSIRIGRYKNLI